MPDALVVADTERLLTAWIERNIGKVVRLEAEPRWRAAWTADVERDGRIIRLYVKGPREVQALVPVKLEGAALDVLNRNGIPAPAQYGYCEEIDAIVMERLEGDSRLENIQDIAVRDKVADEYVQAMVKFHALDPKLFLDAGFAPPGDPAQLRLAQFSRIEATYLSKKRIPEPANEFLRLWVHRNVPTGEIRPAFITGDAFQMIYHKGALKAVMDMEMACIGDPLLDLCCIRMRDLSEKTGSAAAITRRYEELTAKKLDLNALRFHLVAFSAVSSLLISDIIANPGDATDYFEHHVYYHGSLRIALEALAEVLEVTLDTLPEPEPVSSPQTIHLKMLVLAVEQMPVKTDMERYQRSKAAAEIAYLQRRDSYGAAFDRAYLDEVGAVVGQLPTDMADAEAKLETFVQSAGPEYDKPLLRLLHDQELRHCFLADIPQNVRLQRFLREPIALLT
ncbi:MAG: putative Aminoglycoside phosphotransferase [Rhodospirillales bacterium]|nr:putative Aminoglycoside phosphotransferase [Rhodospirillales bacterium]